MEVISEPNDKPGGRPIVAAIINASGLAFCLYLSMFAWRCPSACCCCLDERPSGTDIAETS